MMVSSTIFALSSGQLPSGIAIVRISGPQSGEALRSLAGRMPPPRRATRAMLRATDGTQIDEVLMLWFPAPRSATGEDVAEFHCHGGRAVVAAIVTALSRLDGLRAAEPGEFSRRAFEHGKLDLIAAEALDDLIHADTEAQRRQAFRQLNGLLGDRARDWRQRIIAASALIEAGIDFSDEGDVADDLTAPALAQIAALRAEIAGVLDTGGKGERLREGLVVAITGFPNVGKSALLNRLARREVAIVTPHAGTTRDLLEVRLDLTGYPVTLVDTAGLRETSDPVEQEGIRRAQERAADADLVLWLSDSGVADHSSVGGGAPVWEVRTKIDVGGHQAGADADHRISTVTGAGLDRLIAALAEFAAVQFPTEQGLMTRERHRVLLVAAADALTKACHETEPELVAEWLRQATAALGRLLGRVDVEDVLGEIFARFCIGK